MWGEEWNIESSYLSKFVIKQFEALEASFINHIEFYAGCEEYLTNHFLIEKNPTSLVLSRWRARSKNDNQRVPQSAGLQSLKRVRQTRWPASAEINHKHEQTSKSEAKCIRIEIKTIRSVSWTTKNCFHCALKKHRGLLWMPKAI